MTAPEPRCVRCRRPGALCLCRALAPSPTRTRVVILQHPREREMRMGTARLASLGLAGSELHVGVRFDDHPRVAALAREPAGRVALLYPGSDATPIERVVEPPETLVVVDGTWSTARKMVDRSPLLRSLPRLSLQPDAPSTYRIRREPAPHCLSTLEAIVAALTALEGDGARFAGLRAAFDDLVTTQIDRATTGRVPYRRDRKHRRVPRPSALERLLATRFDDVVVAQAEGNPHHDGGPHELVQLVAVRPATAARFAAIVRPRRPVGVRTPSRLGMEATLLATGSSIDDLRHAWNGFLRPGDVLVGWGRFTPALLAAEGVPCPPWIDLRSDVARRLRRRPGGPDAASEALGSTPCPATAPGRAGHRLATLEALVTAFRAPAS